MLPASAPDVRPVTFVVTELAVGGELFGLLMHCGPFPEDIARLYFTQLIAGLEYCHTRGIIHRDLKPENLVLDEHFNLKIVDFGLAALIDDAVAAAKQHANAPGTTGSTSTGTGAGAGTGTGTATGHSCDDSVPRDDASRLAPVFHSGIGSQPYTAPEVCFNKELYNGRGYRGEPADIWSCAVILFIMMTGTPPFRRPLPKTLNASLRRCKHFVHLLSGFYPPQISPLAKDLLAKIFVMEPEKRPSLAQIKAHPWFRGPVPRSEDVAQLMEEKARSAWANQGKREMAEMVTRVRAASVSSSPAPAPASVILAASSAVPLPVPAAALPDSSPARLAQACEPPAAVMNAIGAVSQPVSAPATVGESPATGPSPVAANVAVVIAVQTATMPAAIDSFEGQPHAALSSAAPASAVESVPSPLLADSTSALTAAATATPSLPSPLPPAIITAVPAPQSLQSAAPARTSLLTMALSASRGSTPSVAATALSPVPAKVPSPSSSQSASNKPSPSTASTHSVDSQASHASGSVPVPPHSQLIPATPTGATGTQIGTASTSSPVIVKRSTIGFNTPGSAAGATAAASTPQQKSGFSWSAAALPVASAASPFVVAQTGDSSSLTADLALIASQATRSPVPPSATSPSAAASSSSNPVTPPSALLPSSSVASSPTQSFAVAHPIRKSSSAVGLSNSVAAGFMSSASSSSGSASSTRLGSPVHRSTYGIGMGNMPNLRLGASQSAAETALQLILQQDGSSSTLSMLGDAALASSSLGQPNSPLSPSAMPSRLPPRSPSLAASAGRSPQPLSPSGHAITAPISALPPQHPASASYSNRITSFSPHPTSASGIGAGMGTQFHSPSGSSSGYGYSSSPFSMSPHSLGAMSFTPPLPSYLRFLPTMGGAGTPSSSSSAVSIPSYGGAYAQSGASMVSGSPTGLLLPWYALDATLVIPCLLLRAQHFMTCLHSINCHTLLFELSQVIAPSAQSPPLVARNVCHVSIAPGQPSRFGIRAADCHGLECCRTH